MNNAVVGKTLENVRKYRAIKLFTTEIKIKNYLVSQPNFYNNKLFHKTNC